jgi:hypothetical protein
LGSHADILATNIGVVPEPFARSSFPLFEQNVAACQLWRGYITIRKSYDAITLQRSNIRQHGAAPTAPGRCHVCVSLPADEIILDDLLDTACSLDAIVFISVEGLAPPAFWRTYSFDLNRAEQRQDMVAW